MKFKPQILTRTNCTKVEGPRGRTKYGTHLWKMAIVMATESGIGMLIDMVFRMTIVMIIDTKHGITATATTTIITKTMTVMDQQSLVHPLTALNLR